MVETLSTIQKLNTCYRMIEQAVRQGTLEFLVLPYGLHYNRENCRIVIDEETFIIPTKPCNTGDQDEQGV